MSRYLYRYYLRFKIILRSIWVVINVILPYKISKRLPLVVTLLECQGGCIFSPVFITILFYCLGVFHIPFVYRIRGYKLFLADFLVIFPRYQVFHFQLDNNIFVGISCEASPLYLTREPSSIKRFKGGVKKYLKHEREK